MKQKRQFTSMSDEEDTHIFANGESGGSVTSNNSTVIPERDHFPLCIVWTPLPLLTWLVPVIGHLGIVKSDGEIHDFAGPYHVNVRLHIFTFCCPVDKPKSLLFVNTYFMPY